MAIKSQGLSSTALSSCRYDTETKDLSITFTSGSTYTYSDVPPEIYEGLISASSPGKYWHSNIKDTYV